MYESFFGFTERPFSAAPLAKQYFPASAIESARQTLSRCIDRAEGVSLLIGPAGSGKSLLCHVLAEQFRDRYAVALLDSGRLCTRRALLQAILFELGLPYRGMEEGDLRLALVDYLSPRAHGDDSATGLLLIVDEAHTLPLRLLEELRLITNIVRQGQPRVRLLLVGGPALEERLANPKLESFIQRIAARCYLESLDRAQTIDYVRQQIRQAGGQIDRLFNGDALNAVYQATDGIPRLINQVCDHALIMACAGGVRQLTPAAIEEAWADLQQLPTPWNAEAGAPDRAATPGIVEFGELDEDFSEDLPAAVPFRTISDEVTPQLSLQESDMPFFPPVEAVADQEEEFQPAGSIRPEVELLFERTANPFHEAFDEEEVVRDPYTERNDTLADRPPSYRGGYELGAQLTSLVTTNQTSGVETSPWAGGLPTWQQSAEESPNEQANTLLGNGNSPQDIRPGDITDANGWRHTPELEITGDAANRNITANALQMAIENSPSAPPMPVSRLPDPYVSQSDEKLIIVDNTVQTPSTAETPSKPPRRHDFRQLFARLRKE